MLPLVALTQPLEAACCDKLLRVLTAVVPPEAADTLGARTLVVHAKDDQAKGFYEHFNLKSSPNDPYHLPLQLMKDLIRMAGK